MGLFRVVVKDGQKALDYLAGATKGEGCPLGCILPYYGDVLPNENWLFCNGSTFDTTKYPMLYLFLGSNRTPDLRGEFLRGAGKRGNDTSNYVGSNVGEHQDATWLPHIYHYAEGWNGFDVVNVDNSESVTTLNYDSYDMASVACDMERRTSQARTDKKGGTIRPTNTSVNYIIKATSNMSESEATGILNLINQRESYSTEEINTGKKWIDGKSIYRVVLVAEENKNVGTTTTVNGWSNTISNVKTLVNSYTTLNHSTEIVGGVINPRYDKPNSRFKYSVPYGSWDVGIGDTVTLEYTKTTD